MSAAEKLKVLDEPARIEYVVNMTATQYRAWKARPQIVAVVEAAEELVPFLPPARQWLPNALSALDEALG